MNNQTGELLPEKLREKYIAERDKRLRDDGNEQYRSLSEISGDFDTDPFIAVALERAAVVEECEVVIVGGGFGGMMAAVELSKKGERNIRIIEKGSDFGGTWYWNRYPGAACDVESYIYMPYLEETGYIPTEKYAKAPEIFEHCQRIGTHFDLYPMALFQTEVEHVEWMEDEGRWYVTTSRKDKLSARFVVMAGGLLHKAKLPRTPGIEDFKGKMFHTSRWDYNITGGSPNDPMEKLGDKTIALIGTGATGVQITPKLARDAKHVFVVQRTPSGVGVRANRPTDPEWASTLKPGWQQERMDNFTSLVSGQPFEEDMVADGWTEIFSEMAGMGAGRSDLTPEEGQMADYRAMEDIRSRVSKIVKDSDTAEALKPWYNRMCKRPCFHDEYLQAYNQPNVELLDSDGQGLEKITENGIVVQGKEYPVDIIAFASGFEVTTDYNRRLGFDVVGRNGRSMSSEWIAPGPHTLHGILAEGFPNLFMFSLIQGGHAINFVHTTLEIAKHVAWIIDRLHQTDATVAEATQEGEESWWNEIMSHLMANAQFAIECTPGFYNQEGSRDASRMKIASYMGGTMNYINILRNWRESDDLAGLTINNN